MGAVPVDRLADRLGTTVAQGEGCGALLWIAHPPHLREVLRPGQIRTQLGEHPAAGLDRGELVGVADQDGLGAGLRGGGEELAQVVGAHHPGLVDHDQGGPLDLQGVVALRLQGFGDGHAFIAGAFAQGHVDGLAGRGQQQHPAVGAVVHRGVQGAQRGGLARTRRRRQRLHQPR